MSEEWKDPNGELHVPTFARISDYCGLWAMDDNAARLLYSVALAMDMKAHFSREPEPLKSLIEKVPAAGGKTIAAIRLNGILMKSASSMGGTSTVQVRRDIRAAVADPDVAGILLLVDSPGGTVAGTDDLASEVKAARRSKPVWAHIDDLGASAAFWVASQADKITANSPTALVGSIGTIQVIQDQSEAAAKEGVKVLVFATGPMKGLGTPGTKVTDDQANHVQGLIDSVQESFDAAVRQGRGLSAKELTDVRHGGVLNAKAALEAKLIDAIQPLSRTINEFTAALKSGAAARSQLNPEAHPVLNANPKGTLPVLRRKLPTL